jgi:hypothetical protein
LEAKYWPMVRRLDAARNAARFWNKAEEEA